MTTEGADWRRKPYGDQEGHKARHEAANRSNNRADDLRHHAQSNSSPNETWRAPPWVKREKAEGKRGLLTKTSAKERTARMTPWMRRAERTTSKERAGSGKADLGNRCSGRATLVCTMHL